MWWWHLVNDVKHPASLLNWNQGLRLLLMRWLRLKLSDHAFLAVQAVAAAFIAALCLAGQRAGWPRRRLLARMLGMACCWMRVFGQATEPSTYILIAPALAWSLWEVWLQPAAQRAGHPSGADSMPGGTASRAVLVTSYVLSISVYVMFWFPWGRAPASYGPEPLAGLLLFGYLIVRSVRELKAAKTREPEPLPLTASAAGR